MVATPEEEVEALFRFNACFLPCFVIVVKGDREGLVECCDSRSMHIRRFNLECDASKEKIIRLFSWCSLYGVSNESCHCDGSTREVKLYFTVR